MCRLQRQFDKTQQSNEDTDCSTTQNKTCQNTDNSFILKMGPTWGRGCRETVNQWIHICIRHFTWRNQWKKVKAGETCCHPQLVWSVQCTELCIKWMTKVHARKDKSVDDCFKMTKDQKGLNLSYNPWLSKGTNHWAFNYRKTITLLKSFL